MIVTNNGISREIKILSCFKLIDGKEYILYRDLIQESKKGKQLYLSFLKKEGERIILESPLVDKLPVLQSIIKNFIDENFDITIVTKNGYKFINLTKFDGVELIETGYKQIFLEEKSYKKLIVNRYLSYPTMKIVNEDDIETEEYQANNQKALFVSSLFMLIMFIISLIFSFILKQNNINLEIKTIFITFIITAIISAVAYNMEEKSFINGLVITFSAILLFILIFMIKNNNMNIAVALIDTLSKTIVFFIPYFISKKISWFFVNKIKARNYLTYYNMFFILFIITGIIVFILNDATLGKTFIELKELF